MNTAEFVLEILRIVRWPVVVLLAAVILASPMRVIARYIRKDLEDNR